MRGEVCGIYLMRSSPEILCERKSSFGCHMSGPTQSATIASQNSSARSFGDDIALKIPNHSPTRSQSSPIFPVPINPCGIRKVLVLELLEWNRE